ncbi:MAG TPA: DegT/DnrJ/EryC1/StrS aminotransferase family protein [Terriglobales bacterium]|nr:DegT/DnrJ/EryC1/StrS aminotransferase family protein [Terriglobales bacterium]
MKSTVLLNDFKAQWRCVREDTLKAVDQVGQSGWFILGEEVARFEQQLATFVGKQYAIGCASGLDAIELGLQILGCQGKPVITTPLSAFATTLAIVRAGGVPIFIDTDESGLLDLNKVEAFLESKCEKEHLLVPVHLFGHSLNLQKLQQLRERFRLRVLEDCAQAIGANSNGKKIGAASDLAALSFYPTKNLGCMGDGGAVITDSEESATLARALRDYGQTGKYRHTYLGMNSRLDEIHAAILTSALLPRVAEFTKRRREIAGFYRSHIVSEKLQIPPEPHGSDSVYHLFPILIQGDRESFQEHLRTQGIQSAVHYPILIPDQSALGGQPFIVEGDLTNARGFAAREVSLPIHPFMSDDDVQRVVAACNTWQQ